MDIVCMDGRMDVSEENVNLFGLTVCILRMNWAINLSQWQEGRVLSVLFVD